MKGIYQILKVDLKDMCVKHGLQIPMDKKLLKKTYIDLLIENMDDKIKLDLDNYIINKKNKKSIEVTYRGYTPYTIKYKKKSDSIVIRDNLSYNFSNVTVNVDTWLFRVCVTVNDNSTYNMLTVKCKDIREVGLYMTNDVLFEFKHLLTSVIKSHKMLLKRYIELSNSLPSCIINIVCGYIYI